MLDICTQAMAVNDLKKKSIRGFVQVFVIFGAGILRSGGTPCYFQAWVFRAVFAGCGAGITVYLWKHDPKLLERRINAGPTAETGKSQKLIMFLSNVAMMAILVIPGLDHRWSW